MTPKQKREKIKRMQNTALELGFVIDRYGNYKKNDVRVKFKKINVRIERRSEKNKLWFNIISQPIVKFPEENFETILIRLINET